jgi:predicted MFS family arabinose efflux permease
MLFLAPSLLDTVILSAGEELLFLVLLFFVGGILQTAAEAIGMLYVGRLFTGFGIGILVEIVPQF